MWCVSSSPNPSVYRSSCREVCSGLSVVYLLGVPHGRLCPYAIENVPAHPRRGMHSCWIFRHVQSVSSAPSCLVNAYDHLPVSSGHTISHYFIKQSRGIRRPNLAWTSCHSWLVSSAPRLSPEESSISLATTGVGCSVARSCPLSVLDYCTLSVRPYSATLYSKLIRILDVKTSTVRLIGYQILYGVGIGCAIQVYSYVYRFIRKPYAIPRTASSHFNVNFPMKSRLFLK